MRYQILSNRILLFFVLPILLCFCEISSSADTSINIKIDITRKAYYRGEIIPVNIFITNISTQSIKNLSLTANLAGYASESCLVSEIPAGNDAIRMVRLHTKILKTGNYELNIEANYIGAQSIKTSESIYIGQKPNPDTLLVWNWGGNGGEWESAHGFNSWPGTSWFQKEFANNNDFIKRLDSAISNNAFANIHPSGGLSEREVDITKSTDPDIKYSGLNKYYQDHNYTLPNPFHPEVAKQQDERNIKLMEFVKDFPQVKTAFFNSELGDMMINNRNKGGLELMRFVLGHTDEEIASPTFVAPNVIADNDKGYLLHKYVHKYGKGLNLTNKRAADMVHRYRPDILTITDPYRETALLDMFENIDVISTWTYTNPDPKMMLYVETMRAVCKPTNQIPLSLVTLLNYPGELAPTDKWMLMGHGPLKVTTWINLSRAPKIIGYFYAAVFTGDITKDSFESPISTSLALKELADKVFKPYGPMITNLDVSPRRVAVLSSESSRLYGKSPSIAGSYANMQIYHFYITMAMAHIQADVVFDESIERFGLKDYDVLVLPKCDVLTQSVYNAIIDFQKRGGIVIADQYLGPHIPGVIKFDFDFTYREKVSANAIANNKAYAQWNDHIDPKNAVFKEVKGITALDDQKIMESYSKTLKDGLRGIVEPEVDCDQPTVLFNMLEKDGIKYLFVINDKRSYDDRVGKYKSMMEKIEPQQVTVRLRNWDTSNLAVYDMLEQKSISVKKTEGVYQFNLNLTELGGKIIALYPRKISKMSVDVPKNVVKGTAYPLNIQIKDSSGLTLQGLQPLQIIITDPKGNKNSLSDYYCANKGNLTVDFVPALNDISGRWKVKVIDLTSGLKAETVFNVAEK